MTSNWLFIKTLSICGGTDRQRRGRKSGSLKWVTFIAIKMLKDALNQVNEWARRTKNMIAMGATTWGIDQR